MKIFDGHCDTVTRDFSSGNGDLFKNNFQLDIERMIKAGEYTQVFAVFIDIDEVEENQYFQLTEKYIKYLKEQISKYNQHISFCKSSDDILKAYSNNKAAALLSIEGAHVFYGDFNNIDRAYEWGMRLLGITWNNSNEFAAGVDDPDKGFTPKGYELLDYLKSNGIIADVSHLSEKSFWDLDNYYNSPYIASHSCCMSLCKNVRNLTDLQIKSLANKGGVIGVNLYPSFLTQNSDAYISDVIAHIKHLNNVGGIDCIALGSDFDGIEKTPVGLENPEKYLDLADALSVNGFKCREIENIFFNNFFRVVKDICK